MIEIKLCGTAEKRPWVAKLTGIEVTEDGKTRFARDFKSCISVSKRFGATNDYVGCIGDGIFEVCEAKCRYYLVVFGAHKVILWNSNIFPDNWREYMRDQNCSYEDVWTRAWGTLCNTHDRMREPKTRPVLAIADQTTINNLEDLR